MSANGSSKPATKKKPAPETRITRLMKRMGSKTGAFDPEPPDQWLYVLRHGRGEEQALAWIKSKTIARGHESPYAIDEDSRKPLTLHDLAADLGWAMQTARNVLNALSAQGRAHIDDKGRIWLCADIPLAHASDEGGPEPESKPEDDFENFVQSYFSGYLADSIRRLPAEQRAAFRTKYSEYAAVAPSIFAEAAAAARAITERLEDTILGEFGLQKRRLEKRRPPKPKFIRLDLIAEPNFVQSYDGEFVQTPEPALYKPENGSVQGSASLLVPDPDPDREVSSSSEAVERPRVAAVTTTQPKPSRPATAEVAELAGKLQWDRNAAARLLASCRERDPAVSVPEILQLALEKWKQVRNRTDISNPVGLYLASIPNMIGSSQHQAVRQRLRAANGQHGSSNPELEARMRAAAADLEDPDHDLAVRYFGQERVS